MHNILLKIEGVKHLPEGFHVFSEMEENEYFFIDSNSDLNIAYDWDYEIMGEELINELNKFLVSDIVCKVLKFCEPFEFVYGGFSAETFYEYYNFDGKKLTIVSGSTLDLDEEDPDACYKMDTAIRYEGEATYEFLDSVNKLIIEGDIFSVSTYDLDGNQIGV
jgi:hypothetical protein|tara:strand:+ start:5860 stop:6348 length:489 start_codon:yes stop_codon:yes gene_type:complete